MGKRKTIEDTIAGMDFDDITSLSDIDKFLLKHYIGIDVEDIGNYYINVI